MCTIMTLYIYLRYLSERLGRVASVVSLSTAIGIAATPLHAEEKIFDAESYVLPVAQAPSLRNQRTLLTWGGNAPIQPADRSSLVTDRPHFSEASSLVGLGVIQVETGYTYFRDSEAGSTASTQSYGEPLLRAGVFAEWFEFRLGYTYLREQGNDGSTAIRNAGSDDLYIGAKLALAEQRGIFPEVAIFPQFRLPTGCDAFSNDEVLPGYNLAYSWMLNDWLEIECNSQMNRRRDDTGHFYTEVIQTLNVEYELTERIGAFTEWFVFIPSGAITAQTEHYFHGGFVFRRTPNTQFDIHAGVGLNKAADDLAFTGVGYSFRF